MAEGDAETICTLPQPVSLICLQLSVVLSNKGCLFELTQGDMKESKRVEAKALEEVPRGCAHGANDGHVATD